MPKKKSETVEEVENTEETVSKPKATKSTVEEPTAEEIRSMATMAHHSGTDQRKHIGTAKNDEGVKCDVIFIVGQDGATSTSLEPIAE